MKKELGKYTKLVLGLILCSFGIVMMLNSKLGVSPWDALNQGLNRHIGITIGEANLLVGFFVVLLSIFLKQPIGSGTIINFLSVGVFIDIYIFFDIVPKGKSLMENIVVYLIGLMIFSYGCYLYISVGLGCGPRDGLMVILTKKLKYPLWKVKTSIELFVLLFGYILGGDIGIGTVIASLSTGPLIQYFFKISKKDIKKIEHRSFAEEIKLFFNLMVKKR